MSSLRLLRQSGATHSLPTTRHSTRCFTTTHSLKKQNRKPPPPKKKPRPLSNFTANQRAWKNETQRPEVEKQKRRAASANALLGTHTEPSTEAPVRPSPVHAHAAPSHGGQEGGSAGGTSNGLSRRSFLSRLREPETFRKFTIFALALALVSQGIAIYTVYNQAEVTEYGEEKKFKTPKYASVGEMEKVCSQVENNTGCSRPSRRLTE